MNDRPLLILLSSVVILVLLALGLFFFRQGSQVYRPDDSPEAVVHNYILALEQRDYARAHSYLLEAENAPDQEAFSRPFLLEGNMRQPAGVRIGATHITGDTAAVDITLLHPGSGPFGSGTWTEQTTASLQRQENAWRISLLPYPFWNYDWYNPQLKPAYPTP